MAELRWTAQYNDNTQLNQIDSDGTKHAYEDIDRTKLSAFLIHEGDATMIRLAIVFDEDGEKLVWTRRTRINQNEGTREVFHIVGKKGEFIMAISESTGMIIARHNFHDDGLMYEVVQ